MKFIALDVETANSERSSICQIGLAFFENNRLVNTWSTYVNPGEGGFNALNISIHKIDEKLCENELEFPEIYPILKILLSGKHIVHHSQFDKQAFDQSCALYRLENIEASWIDSAMMVRIAWPDKYSASGYGLDKVSAALGIEFKHHDALEDAIAAGKIASVVIKESGISISEWFKIVKTEKKSASRVRSSFNYEKLNSKKKTYEGNPNGQMFGKTIVFTGDFDMGDYEVKEAAAEIGFKVWKSVTLSTDVLVVGYRDTSYSDSKSGKQKLAERYNNERGKDIKIIDEYEFMRMVKMETYNT